jgi:hypothetical protein
MCSEQAWKNQEQVQSAGADGSVQLITLITRAQVLLTTLTTQLAGAS